MKMLEKEMAGVTVVAVQGDLNAAEAPKVRDRFLQLLKEGKKSLVIDLGDVTFLASGGIRALYMVDKQARELGGRVVLARLPQPIHDILALTGFLPYFEVRPTVEAGLEALRS
jgi:anti-sigma B factor antagonist